MTPPHIAAAHETIELFEQYVIPNYTPLPGLPGPGRRLVGLGRRGEPLPRLLPRLGLQPARPLPAAGGRGGAASRSAQLIHVPNTWYTEAAGAVRRRRSCERQLRRPVLLLQQRRRGQRGGDQAGPAARHAEGAYKIVTIETASTAGPWRRSTATAQPKYHAGVEPLVPGFSYAPFGDLDAVAQADRRRDVRDPGRADPGRRGRQHPADRLPRRPARAVRRARAAADLRRGADRHGPHRASGSPTSTASVAAGHPDAGQGAGRRRRVRRADRRRRRSPTS